MAIKIKVKIDIRKPELNLRHINGTMMIDNGRIITNYGNAQFLKMVFSIMKKSKTPCMRSRGCIIEHYKDKTDEQVADDTIKTFEKMKNEMKEIRSITWDRCSI